MIYVLVDKLLCRPLIIVELIPMGNFLLGCGKHVRMRASGILYYELTKFPRFESR